MVAIFNIDHTNSNKTFQRIVEMDEIFSCPLKKISFAPIRGGSSSYSNPIGLIRRVKGIMLEDDNF